MQFLWWCELELEWPRFSLQHLIGPQEVPHSSDARLEMASSSCLYQSAQLLWSALVYILTRQCYKWG